MLAASAAHSGNGSSRKDGCRQKRICGWLRGKTCSGSSTIHGCCSTAGRLICDLTFKFVAWTLLKASVVISQDQEMSRSFGNGTSKRTTVDGNIRWLPSLQVGK